jgi:hypothetical protein
MRRLVRLMVAALVVASPVAAALFRVWVYHDAVHMGYELSKEGRRRYDLRRTLQQLEVELAAERSPEQLARRARDLGLAPPTPSQVLGGGTP